jgi:hypothetical protein
MQAISARIRGVFGCVSMGGISPKVLSPGAAATEEDDLYERHTFHILKGLSGETMASFTLAVNPKPNVSSIIGWLVKNQYCGKRGGRLLPIGEASILDAYYVFSDIAPGGETTLLFISGDRIEVKEAGYYNGVYEAMEGMDEPRFCGRRVYKMVEADVDNDAVGERYIHWSGEITGKPEGWKFATDLLGTGWDMFSRGPSGRDRGGQDIPEGKFELDNGGTSTKVNAPRITRKLIDRSNPKKAQLLRANSSREERENIDSTEYGGCFNGGAMVEMADGTLSKVHDIRVGDLLASGPNGATTTIVEGITVEVPAESQRLVQLGNLLLTPHHPVLISGQWIHPISIEGAQYVDTRIELYNFITSQRMPICLEGFVCTSVGTFCEGLHDIEGNLEQRIWGTDLIVQIFQQHPRWPYVKATSAETLAAVHRAKCGMTDHLW